MDLESEKLLKNSLTAEELLRNKGIRSTVWDEYERSNKVLPKTGKKQFEPNGSWLQNMQIDKNLENSKDLISIERVERISQLAIADWLPLQREARVKKRSSQDWSNFGLERNGFLYLIPEEALFLLEANCLELLWNNVPLSVQQAFELLIDNTQCTLEEYRVYSQLTRCGYRIQRFVYEQSDKVFRDDTTKRKVIVDPENGLRLSDSQHSQNFKTTDNESNKEESKKADTNNSDRDIKMCQRSNVEDCISNDVRTVVQDLLKALENKETQAIKNTPKSNISSVKSDGEKGIITVNDEKRNRNSKVEIISDETFVGNSIKVVNGTDRGPQWRASRIQRNVKLLPKRTDKPTCHDVLITDISSRSSEQPLEKRKASSVCPDESEPKKTRQEVIELSDDEIQEIPKPMSKTELLNLLPNIASQSTVTVKVLRGYIPHNVKPQKNVYQYDNKKLRGLYDADMKLRSRFKCSTGNSDQNQSICENTPRNEIVRRPGNIPPSSRGMSSGIPDMFMPNLYAPQRGHFTNFGFPYFYNSFPLPYSQNTFCHNRNAIVQRNMFQNVILALQNHGNAIQNNRFLSVQMNNFMISNITNIRNSYGRNQFRPMFHQNFPPRNLYQQRYMENTHYHSNTPRNSYSDYRQRYSSRDHHKPIRSAKQNEEVYHPSFKILPGASSWSELKTKWREEKTITIDDEDSNKVDNKECNEVEVVEQYNNPLINPRNVTCLADIFEKLRIIKSAPEKTVRRKKTGYRISYNVYSSGQPFKKANPGTPLYRIVVIRQKTDPFLQPIELHRLQQDAKGATIVLACVSMSISYIQAGFVSLPNLT